MKTCFCELKDLKRVDKNSIFNNLKIYISGLEITKNDSNEKIKLIKGKVKDSELIIAFARMENLHDIENYNKLIKIGRASCRERV